MDFGVILLLLLNFLFSYVTSSPFSVASDPRLACQAAKDQSGVRLGWEVEGAMG